MSGAKRYPLDEARAIAAEIVGQLEPYCERIVVAGSIRREKPDVGDIEILYVPKFSIGIKPGHMLESEINLADAEIRRMETTGCLERRLSATGVQSWGEKNKLAIHIPSGIPVDLFSTSLANWWVSLVVRTGSAETNLRLTTGANKLGRTLHAYGCGVTFLPGTVAESVRAAFSERDVFELCGVPFLEPNQR